MEFSAKAAARRKPPCCRVWMSLQQLFLPQFLYAAGFVGIAVSFLHSGASRVLLVQVVPLVEYLRGAGTFLLVLFKRFCFFRPLGKEGIRIQTRKTPLCYRLPMWALQTIGKTEASFYLRVPELPCYTVMPLMVSATETAEELSAAAVTRGIENPARKTSAVSLRLSPLDFFGMLAGLALLVLSFVVQ